MRDSRSDLSRFSKWHLRPVAAVEQGKQGDWVYRRIAYRVAADSMGLEAVIADMGMVNAEADSHVQASRHVSRMRTVGSYGGDRNGVRVGSHRSGDRR